MKHANLIATAIAASAILGEPTLAEPWRLDDALDTPDWLNLSGSYRLRYEWLDNPFRVINSGSDELLVSRLRLKAEAANDTWRAGVELQDSRAWLADNGTPLFTDDVNVLEPLQFYVGLRGRNWISAGDAVDITVGRFTMGMGSNRLIGEHIFRNTRSAFDGARAAWTPQSGPRVQAFLTNPVIRLPRQPSELRDNKFELDEAANTVFWGVHVDRLRFAGLDAEVYLYGLDESYGPRNPLLSRNYLTTGFRLIEDGPDWSWQLETIYQFGDVRSTRLPEDTSRLDHSAWLLHAHLGRTFGGAWRPEIELRYDFGSGDKRPGDGNNERFDDLYGPLRFDTGPTGIYGALRRNNISSPGVYANLHPGEQSVWMIGYKAVWLAERRDFFAATALRDPQGQSGSFVGHQVETRFRWNVLPGAFRFETGAAILFKGEFLKNAPLAPPGGDTVFLYSNFLLTF